MKLTDNYLRSLLPAQTRIEKTDDLAPGLRIRLSGSTGKWSVMGYINGVRKRAPVGDFPGMSCAAARRRAAESRAEMTAGVDRVAEKRAHAAAITAERTMNEQAEAYIATLVTKSERHRETDAWALRAIIAEMKAGDLPPSAVTEGMIEAALDREPRVATRRAKHDALRRCFKRIWKLRIIDANPFDRIDSADRAKPRERHYSAKEVRSVWSVLDQMTDPYADLFALLMLVPLRREEASLIEGQMVDLDEAVLRLPPEITKTDTAFEIMLPESAVEILARRPREGFVFANPQTGLPIQNWDYPLKKARRLSGVRDWRPHDMRRTFSTVVAELGISFEVADACLNHAQSASKSMVTRSYQMAGLKRQKQHAMASWAAALDRAVSTGGFEPEEQDNVVRIA